MTRVVHIVEAYGGGVLETVNMIANGTAAAGGDVTLAYGRRPETPADVASLIDSRVRIVEIERWGSRNLLDDARSVRPLRTLVHDVRPDVVHLHSSYAAVIGLAALGRSAPSLFTPNAFASTMRTGNKALSATYSAIERVACRHVDVIGAVSEDEASIARRFGASNVEVVANGIPELDPDRAITRPGGADVRRVIAIGRTVPQRQPAACARILTALAGDADVAWIGGGGGGNYDCGLQALKDARIPLTGWVPRPRVIAELDRSTAYLHWTGWDGLPFSILEAMARDVIVVASDIGPNRELLGPGQVRRTEEEAIALLSRVLADEEYAESLRENQRRRRVRYSARAMVSGWLDLYERRFSPSNQLHRTAR